MEGKEIIITAPQLLMSEKIIAVIGLSACGKSTTGKQLAERYNYPLISTDSCLSSTMPMLCLHNKIAKYSSNVIVEGMIVYELLRDYNLFIPDVIIECVATTAVRGQRYNSEREAKDFTAFDKVYRSMLADSLHWRPELAKSRYIQHITHELY
jgi:cytidylate kinase